MTLQDPPAGGLAAHLPARAEPPNANIHGLMPREAGALMRSKHTLQLLVQQGKLDVIDAADAEWHIENCTEEYHQGGEAAVHIVTWHARGGSSVLSEGQRVALKVYHRPDGKGGFMKVKDEDDVMREAIVTRRMQRKEVNVLDILRRAGCADFIPKLHGVFQRAGELEELPLYGYAMTAYRHGSLANYLHRTCDRLVPESEFASFFGPSQLAGHYCQLHDVLRRLSDAEVPSHLAELLPSPLATATAPPHAPARPPRRGLLLQDISSGNLLLKKNAGGGCVLLFSDPSRAELMDSLDRLDAKWYISATWLWGSMAAHSCMFDEGADVYSANICMLEVWAVAEGATMALPQLVESLDVDRETSRGVTFVRALCTAMLKRHAMGAKACGIVPRTRRELPLSWLMLWAILLGCDDFHSPEELKSGRRHRRPSVADMADVSARLAAVAEQMEGLEGGMSAPALEAPAGAALVQRCVQLYNRLAALTRLDDPDLLPTDASLRWVATCFLQQEHPLVAAMKRQGDLMVVSAGSCTIPKATAHVLHFQSAVRAARQEAELKSGEEVRQRYQPALEGLLKEYRELQLRVLEVAPPGSELAQWVRAKDAGLPPNLRVYIDMHIKRGGVPPLPVLPPEVAEAEQPPAAGPAAEPAQPCQPRTAAAAAPQPAHTTAPSDAAAVAPAAQLAGAPAVPAFPGQQLHAMQPPQPSGAPLRPIGPVLQPAAAPYALGSQLGACLVQQAPQQAAAHPLTATQLGQGAVEQLGSSDQPAATLLMGAQPTGSQATLPSSPGLLAASPPLGQALGGPLPLDVMAAFGLGFNPCLDITSGAFVQASPVGGGAWQAATTGAAGTAAAAGVASQAQPQPGAAVAAAVPRQPGSPTKKPRLGSYSSRAATAPPASSAQPKPRAFCGLFAAPGAAAAGQPAQPPAPVPEWLRLLRERGPLEAAGELDRLGAGGPSSSSPAASPAATGSPAAASSAGSSESPLLSSEGRRMAAALAGGLSLPDSERSYKRSEVTRYANALELLLTSPLPPAGLEAQHALFRPIDTAAKLAWFLGWWASKERKAPLIPGLDLECSNIAKAAWTQAVLDAAAAGGKFTSAVEGAHKYTMPYVAQALLQRLLAGRPLFAAAVSEAMQKM